MLLTLDGQCHLLHSVKKVSFYTNVSEGTKINIFHFQEIFGAKIQIGTYLNFVIFSTVVSLRYTNWISISEWMVKRTKNKILQSYAVKQNSLIKVTLISNEKDFVQKRVQFFLWKQLHKSRVFSAIKKTGLDNTFQRLFGNPVVEFKAKILRR